MPPCQFGGLRGRRREETVVIRLATAWRLAQTGHSFIQTFVDQANAFGAVRPGKLREVDERFFRKRDVALAIQSHAAFSFDIDDSDGVLRLAPQDSVLQGHQPAPNNFVRSTSRAPVEWQKNDLHGQATANW